MQYFISLFDKSEDTSTISHATLLQSLLNSLASSLQLPSPSLILSQIALHPRLCLLSPLNLIRLYTASDLKRDFCPVFPGLKEFLVGESGGIISGFLNQRGESLNLSREIRVEGGPQLIVEKVEKNIRKFLRLTLLKGLKGGDNKKIPLQIVLLINDLVFFNKLTVLLIGRKPILSFLTEITGKLTDFLSSFTEKEGKNTDFHHARTENRGKNTEFSGVFERERPHYAKFLFRDALVLQMLRQIEILQDFINNKIENIASFEYLSLPKFSMEIGRNSPFFLRFKQLKDSGQNDLLQTCINELTSLNRRKEELGSRDEIQGHLKKEEVISRKEESIAKKEENVKKASIFRNSVITFGKSNRLSIIAEAKKSKEEGEEVKKEDGKEEIGHKEEEEGRLEGFDVILSVLNYKAKYGFDIVCGNEGFVWTNSASRAVFGMVTVMMSGGVTMNGQEGIGKRETIKVTNTKIN
jgi:hypothetical protein